MTIQFQCRCGLVMTVADEHGGRTGRCPQCGQGIQVPPAAPVRGPTAGRAMVPVSQRASYAAEPAGDDLVTLPRIFLWMFLGWAGLAVLTMMAAMVSWITTAAMVFLLLIVTVALLIAAGNLMAAKARAMKSGRGYAWGGTVEIVAWNPMDGIVFLKDKAISYVDSNPHDGGGVRIIFPFLGEEEAIRAPLEEQTLGYDISRVRMRENVEVTVQGTIFWQIVNLERFYLLVSREIHQINDGGGHAVVAARPPDTPRAARATHGTAGQLESAEEWLKRIAAAQIRSVVARVPTGLLIADRIAQELPPEIRARAISGMDAASGLPSRRLRAATDDLAEKIAEALASIVPEYGIAVTRVSVEDAKLPEEIHKAAVRACLTHYDPIVAQREAAVARTRFQAEADGRQAMLQGEANVIGPEAVAKREVLGAVQPFALGGRASFDDFLKLFFEQNYRRPTEPGGNR